MWRLFVLLRNFQKGLNQIKKITPKIQKTPNKHFTPNFFWKRNKAKMARKRLSRTLLSFDACSSSNSRVALYQGWVYFSVLPQDSSQWQCKTLRQAHGLTGSRVLGLILLAQRRWWAFVIFACRHNAAEFFNHLFFNLLLYVWQFFYNPTYFYCLHSFPFGKLRLLFFTQSTLGFFVENLIVICKQVFRELKKEKKKLKSIKWFLIRKDQLQGLT